MNRIFLITGNTNDMFISSDLQNCSFQIYLHKHLKGLGYERIVYYSGIQTHGKYVLDDESAKASFFVNKNNESSDKKKTGAKKRPGAHNRKKSDTAESDNNNVNSFLENNNTIETKLIYSQPRMQELTFLSECKKYLTDNSQKTAVVFTYFQDFINNSEGLREYFSFFKESFTSYKSYQNNENICIFIARAEESDVIKELFDRNTELKDIFLTTRDLSKDDSSWSFDRNKVCAVGLPKSSEITYFLEYLRIVGNHYISGHMNHKNQKLLFKHSELNNIVSSLLYFSRLKNEDLNHIKTRLIKFMKRNEASTVVSFCEADILNIYGSNYASEKNAIEQLNKKGWESVYDKMLTIANDYASRRSEYEKKHPIIADSADHRITYNGRLDNQINNSFSYRVPNFILLGNPGVGKTTCARLMGKALQEIGILESGHVVQVSRDTLIAGYVGQTAIKTRRCIEQAQDGVLFIDEAYSIIKNNSNNGNDNDFGTECIDTLVNAMTDNTITFSLIMAGYPDDMDRLFAANSGLKRRFGRENVITIPNYKSDLLAEIFQNKLTNEGFVASSEVMSNIETYFQNLAYRYSKKEFGNADEAIRAADNAIAVCRKRNPESNVVEISDFGITQELFTNKSEKSVDTVIANLGKFTGLKNIKQLFWDMEYTRRDCLDRGKNYLALVKHMIFVGNPGTGKTTVAKMMGELLYRMGSISNPEIKEMDASALMGGSYINPIETINRIINEVADKGMLLFIDEAHQFINFPTGKSVIDAMMKPMSDKDNYADFKVIFAVYESQLNAFYGLNDGLKSRVQEVLFPDYTPYELFSIFEGMAFDENIFLSVEAKDKLLLHFQRVCSKKTEHFGNARYVAKILDDMENSRKRRVYSASNYENKFVYIATDVPD